MKPNARYGPVGSRILFENDFVRVWEISLEPGEHLPLHYHALPYLVVIIEAAHIRVVEHDGRAYDPTDAPGDVNRLMSSSKIRNEEKREGNRPMHTQQQRPPSEHMVSRWSQLFYVFVAWLFALCIVAQAFLAGLSIFSGPGWWVIHVEAGHWFNPSLSRFR
jgi:hypothetical protein